MPVKAIVEPFDIHATMGRVWEPRAIRVDAAWTLLQAHPGTFAGEGVSSPHTRGGPPRILHSVAPGKRDIVRNSTHFDWSRNNVEFVAARAGDLVIRRAASLV